MSEIIITVKVKKVACEEPHKSVTSFAEILVHQRNELRIPEKKGESDPLAAASQGCIINLGVIPSSSAITG